jgi:hypothetical protein
LIRSAGLTVDRKASGVRVNTPVRHFWRTFGGHC